MANQIASRLLALETEAASRLNSEYRCDCTPGSVGIWTSGTHDLTARELRDNFEQWNNSPCQECGKEFAMRVTIPYTPGDICLCPEHLDLSAEIPKVRISTPEFREEWKHLYESNCPSCGKTLHYQITEI